MGHQINLFMWGYQPHFRIGLETFAKRVLEDAGVAMEVEALLVGVREPGKSGHPVCVEPENGAWPVTLFENIDARVAELVDTDHRKNMVFGDAPSNRDLPAWIRATAVRGAVTERLGESDRTRGVRSFLGAPTHVGSYLVVPVLQIRVRDLARIPALRRSARHEFRVHASYFDALIEQILSEAARELASPEPGRFLGSTFERESRDVQRAAGRSFMRTAELACYRTAQQTLFDGANDVSGLRYEGSVGAGSMVVARREHPAVHTSLSFQQAVPVRSATWARKVLQMGSAEVVLLCDGSTIYGLGRLCDAYDPTKEDAFCVDFVGHHTWELRHAGVVLMRVAYGVPRLPAAAVTEDAIRTLVRRVFGNGTDVDPARIWALVAAAIEQRHGTLLVVSGDATGEASRLAAQATPVAPTHLGDEIVRRVTGIDGAVLVDTAGRCYAIGVILDGVAIEDGDPARGARFNSAYRYVATTKAKTIALVVSEDGHVNTLPILRPEVRRTDVERHVARLTELSDDINSDWHKERNWLHQHRFYLNAEQCQAVNAALKNLRALTLSEERRIWTDVALFKPDNEMNENYFVSEG